MIYIFSHYACVLQLLSLQHEHCHSLTDAVVGVGWQPVPIDSLLEPDDHLY